MEYVFFALLVVVLAGLVYILRRMDTRAKNKHRKAAYKLLEATDPGVKEIKDALKALHLYGGRWRRDKEFAELARRLADRLNKIKE